MKELLKLENQVNVLIKTKVQEMIGAVEAGSQIIFSTITHEFLGSMNEETEDSIIMNDAYIRMMDSIATFKVYADKM